VSKTAPVSLFGPPWESLSAVAQSLLPIYRRRRLIIAFEDLLGDSAAAESVAEQIGPNASVSWLPEKIEPPDSGADWSWGISAAERVLQLELDLLSAALPRPTDELVPSRRLSGS